MKKIVFSFFVIAVCFSVSISAQIPINTLVQISKAEDELRFDKTLENLMKSTDARIRARAALAAGRIGNEAAVPALINLLENDKTTDVRATTAFALGEIESSKASDAILRGLKNAQNPDAVRARLTEAAGKIAAANAKDEKSKSLGEAILDALEFENQRGAKQNRDVVLLGLTAVLRARPEKADVTTAKFLNNPDARIRADAGNTLTRIRAKNANEKLRAMLSGDSDPVARANAARALGAAEDKEAVNLLIEAATADKDTRARVSAIRSLASLRDAKAAGRLLERGERLLADYKKSKFAAPVEKNELLEIATALGRILPNSSDKRAVEFLQNFRQADKFISPETEIALARVAPKIYVNSITDSPENVFGEDWRSSSAAFQGLGEIANLEANKENDELKARTRVLLARLIGGWVGSEKGTEDIQNTKLAVPDLLRAFAAFKSENTSNILRPMLEIEQDLFIRGAIADILGDQPVTKENVEALQIAFAESLKTDNVNDDAQLSILSALVKLDKQQAANSLNLALDAPNILVRRRAADLIRQNDLAKDFPNFERRVGAVKPYDAKTGTKIGQILNTNADYIRALSRKNARAIIQTEKGSFTIEFTPEAAPLTVDNFIKLAKSGYFDGLVIHRVVPNFVIQDGDPVGNGSGGPGWSIRDEINTVPYERGAVGMALSGKDTGGSQWFVTHSPQPHLDGGYTVFGRVNETDMKIVDMVVRGDKIMSVKIVEGSSPQKSTKGNKK
ncbi:MAG TPA: peptidylprolyl isomerase [Pyrinomonadaceae bacterium]|nr:peptidylprolyl isomerase [Pyrinomonadaceae bacterium]